MGIVVIDYGVGNVRSLMNALCLFTTEVEFSNDLSTLENAEALILPGVGSFGAAAEKLRHLRVSIFQHIQKKKPILGICLGMQLFFEESEESPGFQGLGIFPGVVKRFSSDLVKKVPNIGWLGKFYFCHSFVVPSGYWECTKDVYEGQEFVSSLQHGSIFGCQFHPEKSGKNGLTFLQNFVNGVLCMDCLQMSSSAPVV